VQPPNLTAAQPFSKQMKIPHDDRDEAKHGDEEHEVFDALHGMRVVQGDLYDLRDVLREKRDGNGRIENRICHARRLVCGQRHEDETDGKGDEKVSDFVSMAAHGVTSSFLIGMGIRQTHAW